jgi:predicted nucleic-acid-binding protein
MPSAVDTNVFIRFLVDDGSDQVAPARRLFSSQHVFISTSVMLETEWVLRSKFGFRRTQICDAFDRALGFDTITIQDVDLIETAIEACRGGMDFADALHIKSAAGCNAFYTFDKKLIRKARQEIPIPLAKRP